MRSPVRRIGDDDSACSFGLSRSISFSGAVNFLQSPPFWDADANQGFNFVRP
ncbi:hypothetical protein RMSM_06831 [Rhodopirellula maiorica SM1]|uniref:Uncharacterized protein n=1 Tax=Rhodopirellula maiorica SM1 TaxID=1265738 RepID=M5RLJ3_9BACT|nr:hypothetical protein RMSM_06831 [Rhodopirellula maiorica SM1]